MSSRVPLPPIDESSFDGEHQSTTIHFEKCNHSKVYLQNGELRCSCGSAWTGPGLDKLYTILHKS
jgi:hypothetical protein